MLTNRRRPFSLAARLTLFISGLSILAFFAFTWIMVHSVQKHFAEQDINDLREVSSNIAATLSDHQLPTVVKLADIGKMTTLYQRFSIYLRDDNGVVYQTPGNPGLGNIPASLYLQQKEYFLWHGQGRGGTMPNRVMADEETFRVIATPVAAVVNGQPARYTLLTAMSIDFHLHYIDSLKHRLILSALVICLLLVAVVLLVVHQAHAPLRRVSRKIRNISSENLDVRLDAATVPIELSQLVISFNQMIERIEDVFTRQSHFSADIAHEMRTPITNLITQTEIALSQTRSQAELEEILYSNLEEFRRMAKMVSDMLFLAQADNNQLVAEKTTIDLRQEVEKVFDFFEAWAEEQQVALSIAGHCQPVSGDGLMLRRAINNLLSNAVRYTPAGGTVSVELNDVDAGVALSVTNPGPAIAAEHLPRLFDRFYRVDPSRSRKKEGSGIGLAIVKSIVTAHGGKITVSSGELTCFTLTLPALK